MRTIFATTVLSIGCLTFLAAFGQEGNAPVSEQEAIVKEMLSVLEQITDGLKTVTDEASAAAAKPGMQQAAARWQQVRLKADASKPPSKTDKARLEPYAEKFVVAQKQLLGQIGRVIGVPGGRELLKEIRVILTPADKAKKSEPAKSS